MTCLGSHCRNSCGCKVVILVLISAYLRITISPWYDPCPEFYRALGSAVTELADFCLTRNISHAATSKREYRCSPAKKNIARMLLRQHCVLRTPLGFRSASEQCTITILRRQLIILYRGGRGTVEANPGRNETLVNRRPSRSRPSPRRFIHP